MSYRDLRNFSESMRILGFPKLISLESFRVANFPLVEEIVRWLATRVERDVKLGGGSGSVEARVELITQAVSFFLTRLNVRVSGRRLYGADGWAARELQRVCGVLRAALHPHRAASDAPELTYDVSAKMDEIRQARRLATDITARGAYLYELLAREPENKESRERALSRPLELHSLEGAMQRALAAAAQQLAAARERCDGAVAAASALDAKLERRRADLQRANKRHHTLMQIKPSYQGELTALESEIEQLWDQYVLKYRCVEALKHQLSTLEAAQSKLAEEQQAAILQLISKYETEDVLGKLSDSDEGDSSEEQQRTSETKPPRPPTRPRTRLRIKTAGASGAGGSGGVGGGDSPDDIRDEDVSDTDSDVSDARLFGGGDDPPGSRWRGRPATRNLLNDDDFNDLIEGVEDVGMEGGGSLGSSSESELRSEAARPSAAPRPDLSLALASDNEF